MCGVITGIARKRNKRGEAWASFQLEDHVGSTEALLFASNFERLAPLLIEDQAVFVRAVALPEEAAATKISIQEMVPLEKVEEEIHTVLNTSDRLVVVTAVADPKRGERIVVLHLPVPISPAPKAARSSCRCSRKATYTSMHISAAR